MDSTNSEIAVLCACLGVLSHVGYFNRGKHLSSAPRLVLGSIIIPLSLIAVLAIYLKYPPLKAFQTVGVGYASYLITLFTSIVIYRLFLHPLRHFPGPKLAPITQFYHTLKVYPKGVQHLYLDQLHTKYGEYVRIGPNVLSIANPDWVEPVHSRHTHFQKGDWYDVGLPRTSLQQMRDPIKHDKRRRHGWDKAFTAASLRSYDSRIMKHSSTLIDQIRRRSDTKVNITEWFNAFAFDVMGDLVFAKSFKALETGSSHPVIDAIHKSNGNALMFHSLPWLLEIILLFAEQTVFGELLRYSNKYVKERQTYEPEESDIMSHILGAGKFFDDEKEEGLLLETDSRLLIIAGSDTTAAALTFASYNFARNPSILENLRSELDQYGIADPTLTVQQLHDLPYLNAVINETLRLHPPVPSGFFRETPVEGVTIDGHFVPGGVNILTPQHSIHRSPKAFVKPKEFIPERWTTSPELILKKDAFFPFIIGKFSCIGKQLALNELRVVIARLALEFDIAFADGEDGTTLLEKSKDSNVMILAKLDLIFTSRAGKLSS